MMECISQILLYGPIIYAAVGYWMYSNPTLTGLKSPGEIKSSHDRKNTQHFLSEAFTQLSPGTPFLILFMIAVIAKLD